jgi:hypothetical protein
LIILLPEGLDCKVFVASHFGGAAAGAGQGLVNSNAFRNREIRSLGRFFYATG